jgi:CDP-diacylglycerol--serine O-phosphatidyltransferase
LNAEIPLFSLKVKKFHFKGNELQIIFLLIAIVLLLVLKIMAVPLIILMYVLISVIQTQFFKRSF